MTRLHIPPRLDGRALNAGLRESMLMQEGETWTTLTGLAGRQQPVIPLRIVAFIWHGDYGSILRGPRDHLERCAPASESVLRMRSHES